MTPPTTTGPLCMLVRSPVSKAHARRSAPTVAGVSSASGLNAVPVGALL
jgi:hypothetical protein